MSDGREPHASPSLSLDRRRFLVGGLLAAGAATAYARKPSEVVSYLGDRKLEDLIPKQIGAWDYLTSSGLVVPTEDALSAALYSQLVTRVYTNGKDAPMMLLVAQGAGQSGVLQIHRPEFCYPAGGFELSPIVPVPLPVGGGAIDVNKLSATIPGRAEQIVYWTRVGNHMPLSWAQQRMAVAMDNLKGIIPDAVLTRISTIDTDRDAAFSRLADFAEQLLSKMGANRNVLIA
ncbi:EpsI family protein [Sphingomonas kaistensis]|uniref:EpsI family protein n=1 Tax=Sphingomonas kaistensis TaxID=298708 RepID=A0A7X5Y4Q1_9SPHN|nr:exosortase-associated protein EpsI, V-type [Sphingomonas kaistensis]NJC04487.1 EpsI family protein [Sphingomonas kaistensis]